MKGHVDLLGPATKVGEVMGIPSFDTPDYSELFAEKDLIVKLKKFMMVAGSAVQRNRIRLTTNSDSASDMLIEIYMAESTILRTEKLAKKKVKIK
jgi:hypothetical protein